MQASREREKKVVSWLESIAENASHIYLVGDIFDFWFEYKHVVPKGYTRLLGCLASLSDRGIKITAFKGNHDMWMFGYFEEELGIPVISDELIIEHHGKKFYISHGDGIGPGDKKYKMLKKVFRSKFCQKLFSMLHPSIGIGMANYFSGKSRMANGGFDKQYLGDENEWLLTFCKEYYQKNPIDYFVFGHRHLPLDLPVNEHSRYINLGDWISDFTYAEFDGERMELKKF
jgi:UDP-2,3-diacylglucosamine hydrolase